MNSVTKAKRGYVPEDERNFSPSAMKVLRTASGHVEYLINEGYDLKQAVTFVGNHFLLSERQRLSVMRSVATREQLNDRENKSVPVTELAGRDIWIDGFNTIITLEVLESDSILFECMDGTIRDLAALRGTYRIIPETRLAVDTLFSLLENLQVNKVSILLDEPVSNSGRLGQKIKELFEKYDFETEIIIINEVDYALKQIDGIIVSGDAIILDNCKSWYNLVAKILEKEDLLKNSYVIY